MRDSLFISLFLKQENLKHLRGGDPSQFLIVVMILLIEIIPFLLNIMNIYHKNEMI